MFNPYQSYLPLASAVSPLRRAFSFTNILNNAQKTLNIVNQTIPIVQEVRPIVRNARTLFKVANKLNQGNTSTITKQEKINNNLINYKIEDNNEGPSFFI